MKSEYIKHVSYIEYKKIKNIMGKIEHRREIRIDENINFNNMTFIKRVTFEAKLEASERVIMEILGECSKQKEQPVQKP